MSHLSTAIVVQAPPALVYDFVADPVNGRQWQTLVGEVGEIAGRPGGVGSSYVGHYRVAGRRVEGRFIVTAAERPSLLQLAGTTPGGWVRWTTLFAPVGDGTELKVGLEYELPGELVRNLYGMLTGHRLEREFDRTYERLKTVVEALARGETLPEPVADAGEDEGADDVAEGHLGRVASG